MDDTQDAYTLTVGTGISLCRCRSCGHYMSVDRGSMDLSTLRCHQCQSSMICTNLTPEEIQRINDWLDTQMLFEHWRGPMTPRIA